MKKNVMMRVASIMLIMVLLTSSVISGTFAKYTTQDTGTDEARVAKWGVELQVVGNLYGETYKDTIVADTSAEGDFTVQSRNLGADVVAPGTENTDGFTFSLQGTPEVSGKITATVEYENIYLNAGTYGLMVQVPDNVITAANFNEYEEQLYTEADGVYTLATVYASVGPYYTLEDMAVLGDNYYPVEYAMIGTGTPVTDYNTAYNTPLTTDTLAKIGDLIGGKLGGATVPASTTDGRTTATYTSEFHPNENLETIVMLGNQEINWKWDYCQLDDNKSGDDACEHCKADTILGLLQGNDNDPVNGKVVKLQDDGTYKAPEAASGTALNDYNLESYFFIDITVTQEN